MLSVQKNCLPFQGNSMPMVWESWVESMHAISSSLGIVNNGLGGITLHLPRINDTCISPFDPINLAYEHAGRPGCLRPQSGVTLCGQL